MKQIVDILVVDDERINLKLIDGILRGRALNLVLTGSGEEALDAAKNHDFAVALLDVMMPGMDGFELAEKLREFECCRNLPVIFITAISKEQKHVFRGYELGAVDYLFKPVEPEILRGKVATFAELHRNKHSLEEATRNLEKTVRELEMSQVALQESEKRYRMVADYNYDWESWIDPEGRPIYISPSCERISGYPPGKFFDNPEFIENIIYRDDIFLWHNYMSDTTTGNEEQAVDFRINHRDTHIRWVSLIKHAIEDNDGKPLGIRTNIRDVTNRKRMEQQLKHSTLHDPITGLPNRALFLDRLSRVVERTESKEGQYGVLFMNIDRFQAINDHYGHSMGDNVLVSVAHRLKDTVRSSDTVARFGGDEFVILFEETADVDELREVVATIQESFSTPFFVENVEFPLTASFGLEYVRKEGVEHDELVHNAQLAMYRAKQAGRKEYIEYSPKMREGIVNIIAAESDLSRALKEKEFEVYYQPIVNLADGSLYGFEALARWNHPQKGLVSPGEFIPIAEGSGLIVELGAQVLEMACTTLSNWIVQYPAANKLAMAVNISAKQFAEGGLINTVENVLEKTGLPARQLKLEITETVVMGDVVESTGRLNALKSLGVMLSIDDFGTGYSSMSYLQKFPLDQLKIDLSFVRKMEQSPENIEIVRAIVNMAHSLRLRVVAEGIETERQRDLLYSLQCDYGQGYLYAKPLPTGVAEKLLDETE